MAEEAADWRPSGLWGVGWGGPQRGWVLRDRRTVGYMGDSAGILK